jgi:hypothetical protein
MTATANATRPGLSHLSEDVRLRSLVAETQGWT